MDRSEVFGPQEVATDIKRCPGHRREQTTMNSIRIAGLALVGFAVLVEPALAGPSPVPGPIAGVGLPALVLVGAAYWIGRKFLGRKR